MDINLPHSEIFHICSPRMPQKPCSCPKKPSTFTWWWRTEGFGVGFFLLLNQILQRKYFVDWNSTSLLPNPKTLTRNVSTYRLNLWMHVSFTKQNTRVCLLLPSPNFFPSPPSAFWSPSMLPLLPIAVDVLIKDGAAPCSFTGPGQVCLIPPFLRHSCFCCLERSVGPRVFSILIFQVCNCKKEERKEVTTA